MPQDDPSFTVRPLDTPEEMRETVALYRTVFGLAPTDPAVGPRLLAALRQNGGSVIGAFDGPRLVGFVYGFPGIDRTTMQTYHYSQTAAVLPEFQGKGVGRALKLRQRDDVLATGIARMRWSFDPVRAGNAHFNLDVLGARARWFVRNLYGMDDMGRDVGHTSDRLIVEWDLERPAESIAVADSPRVDWGCTRENGDDLLIGTPRHWSPTGARAAELRKAISEALESALCDGWTACSCRAVSEMDAVYILRR